MNREKRLDAKVAQETTIESGADLHDEVTTLIQSSDGLNADQKRKLLALRDSVREKNRSFMKESLRMRSVLIKDLIASDYNAKEVSLIKRKIRKLEDKRVSIVFEAIEQANSILGRQAAANQKLISDLPYFQGMLGK